MLEFTDLIYPAFGALVGAILSPLLTYHFLLKRERDSNKQKRKQVATQLYRFHEADKHALITPSNEYKVIRNFEERASSNFNCILKQSQSELAKSVKDLMDALKDKEGVRPEMVYG